MIQRTLALILITSAFAACGEDERLTKEQLSAEVDPRVETVKRSFADVFETRRHKIRRLTDLIGAVQ